MDLDLQNDAGEQFASLLIMAQPKILAYVRNLVFVKADIDDILQEIAMAAWKSFETYDRSRPFDLWIFGVARNQLRTYYRYKKKDTVQFSSETMSLIAQEAIEPSRGVADRQEALAVCMEKLEAEDRSLVCKRYEPDATNRSVARELGLSETRMSRKMSRIHAALMLCIRRSISEGGLA